MSSEQALTLPARASSAAATDRAAVSDTTFVLSSDAVRDAFATSHIYPLNLASGSIYDAALRLFLQWLEMTAGHFAPEELPWLPVGRVGPMPVLGHYQPSSPPLLPTGWFQPVLLRQAEYERHLHLCTPLVQAGLRARKQGEDVVAARRGFPGVNARLIRPTTLRAALRFLLEYFPHDRSDHVRVQELLVHSDDIADRDLPAGYCGACWVLLNRGAVADPTVVAVPELMCRRLPAGLDARIRVISEYARNVWIGLERLPQPDVEDLVRNELGDGWNVHCVLIDPIRTIAKAPPTEPYAVPLHGAENDARAGRPRVKIEDARARTRSADGQREPGVIRLTQKDLRELDSYNPRRPDRDPLKVFLKELSAGIVNGATDLHVEVGLESYRVRARIDGWLEEWLEMPVDFGKMVVGAAKEQFGMPPERWLPQDGACTVFHGSEIVNLRVAAYPVRGVGQKLAIRYLPRRGEVPRLDELMPSREAGLVRRAITRPYGLILLCGPTGSGKTTTTFSALAEINRADINITTMEDPVEYEMDGLNQAELDRARGVDWDALLSAFLRQDPDVGMVGEIRDRATAETAIRLTLTGHIVFATLHTMSCSHTVERLVDSGVNAQMFANAATLIVSQRLVRRLCRRCKPHGRREPSAAERMLFSRHGIDIPEFIFEPPAAPCADCRHTGFKGQVAAFEVLPITDEVAQLIAEKKPAHSIESWMRQHQFQRVYQSALALVARGETSLDEANQWQAVWDELNPREPSFERKCT